MTDMIFVGFGIFLGGLVGLLTIVVGGLPLTLTASGGALIMGLVFGWLRAVHPTFGRIPDSAMWIFDTVGLTQDPASFRGSRSRGSASSSLALLSRFSRTPWRYCSAVMC